MVLIKVERLEQTDQETRLIIQNLHNKIHHMEVDISDNRKKIATETDLRKKDDDELRKEIHQVMLSCPAKHLNSTLNDDNTDHTD